jgi:hypothetical protein
MTRCFGQFWHQWCDHCELTVQRVSSFWEPAPRITPAQSQPEIQIQDPEQTLLRLGDRVECRGQKGLFRSCRCGSNSFTVMSGAGPHAAQLRCDECGCGGRWVGRFHMEPQGDAA